MAEEVSTTRLYAFSRNTSTGGLSYLGNKIFSRGRIIASESNSKIYYCSDSVKVEVYEISSSLPDPFILIDDDLASQSIGCGGFIISSDDSRLLKVAKNSDNVITYRTQEDGLIEQLLTYPPSQVENINKVSTLTSANNSPHVYVSSTFSSSISTFYRELDGSLTYMDSFVYVDNGVSGNDGLSSIFDIAISNDGLYLYSAGYGDNEVGFYTRNNNPESALHGLLTFQNVYKNGVNGVTGLGGVYSLKLSSDASQEYLYTTSLTDDSITVFARNIDGSLNQIQTVNNTTHSGTLNDPAEIHLNSDNTRAYVVSFLGHAVFEYDVVNGQLNYSETLDDSHFGFVDEYFRLPTSLALINKPGLPEHNSFYLFSEENDKITFIQRDNNTGNYTIGPAYSHPNLLGICSIIISPSQDYLNVSCRNSDIVKTFKINSDYSLTPINLFKQLQNLVIGIDQPGLSNYSYDGDYLYVPGYLSNGFAVFKTIDDFIFGSGFDK
jgi:6-phosphogluconolactonase (cycloisomerase 2 family)